MPEILAEKDYRSQPKRKVSIDLSHRQGGKCLVVTRFFTLHNSLLYLRTLDSAPKTPQPFELASL